MNKMFQIVGQTSVSDDAPPLADDLHDAFIWDDVYCALTEDNKDEFVKSFNKLTTKEYFWSTLKYMYMYDAVNCAASVLAGETKEFNLSTGISGVGWTPIHECAAIGGPRITALLLENGFAADTRSECHFQDLENPLPLNVALEHIRSSGRIPYWDTVYTHRKSAIKLVMELCGPLVRSELQVVRLLAQNSKEVKHEFFNYLKQGKMVEVGALLTAAYRHFLPICTTTTKGFLVLNDIREVYGFLSAKKDIWASLYISEEKLADLEGTLLLLKIFDEIGDQLSTYSELPHDNETYDDEIVKIASLIQSGGFDVRQDDIIAYDPSRSVFEWKVLQRGPPKENDASFYTPHKTISLGEMRGLEALGCHSFHTASIPKVDSNWAPYTSARRLANVVPKVNPCNRWTFLIPALRRVLRRV